MAPRMDRTNQRKYPMKITEDDLMKLYFKWILDTNTKHSEDILQAWFSGYTSACETCTKWIKDNQKQIEGTKND